MLKRYVKWAEVDQFVREVSKKYEESGFDGVYGLPRGGLVFATMLSHRMNLPLLMAPTKHCLIVDDICDSGESLVHYVKNSSNPEDKSENAICTMFSAESQTDVVPDFYMLQSYGNWVVFPWEVD